VPLPSYYGGNIYDDSPSTALPAPAAGNGSAAKGKVASLIDRLKDSDSRVRLEATLSLAKVSEDALPALREALKSPDRLVRMGAALALGHMGTTAKVAVPDLKTALKDPEVAVRCHAAQALWRITRQADDALPVLVQALAASKDRNVRMGVVTTLSQMGKAAWQAEPALEGALKDADPQVRLGAVVALLVDEVVRLPAPRRERPGPEIGCAGHRIREPAPC